jgi:hypothetical protein
MDENDHLSTRKYQIGFPWQVFAVQPEAQTKSMQSSPQDHLGLGVATTYPTHVEAALLQC